MTGLAISSVTRPPPSGSPWRGRLYKPLTRVSESSNRRGPSRPVTKWGPKLVTSASTKAMRSASVARRADRMACPFPPCGASAAMTRAPASAASAAVRSVEPSSVTTTSSMRGTSPAEVPRVDRMASTTGPTVEASLRAGIQTAIRRSPLHSRSNLASNWECENRSACSPGVRAVAMKPSSLTLAHGVDGRCRARRRRLIGCGRPAPRRSRGGRIDGGLLFVQNGCHHPERLRDRALRRRGNQSAKNDLSADRDPRQVPMPER